MRRSGVNLTNRTRTQVAVAVCWPRRSLRKACARVGGPTPRTRLPCSTVMSGPRFTPAGDRAATRRVPDSHRANAMGTPRNCVKKSPGPLRCQREVGWRTGLLVRSPSRGASASRDERRVGIASCRATGPGPDRHRRRGASRTVDRILARHSAKVDVDYVIRGLRPLSAGLLGDPVRREAPPAPRFGDGRSTASQPAASSGSHALKTDRPGAPEPHSRPSLKPAESVGGESHEVAGAAPRGCDETRSECSDRDQRRSSTVPNCSMGDPRRRLRVQGTRRRGADRTYGMWVSPDIPWSSPCPASRP